MSRSEYAGNGGKGSALKARERYGSARLVSAVLFAACAAALVQLHFHFDPPGEWSPVAPVFGGAAVAGLWAGWALLGVGLGRGPIAASMLSLTSAAAALCLFCTLAGAKSVVDTYAYGSFSTAMRLFEHLLRRAIGTGEALLESPALLGAAAAALAVGMIAEAVHESLDVAREPEA